MMFSLIISSKDFTEEHDVISLVITTEDGEVGILRDHIPLVAKVSKIRFTLLDNSVKEKDIVGYCSFNSNKAIIVCI